MEDNKVSVDTEVSSNIESNKNIKTNTVENDNNNPQGRERTNDVDSTQKPTSRKEKAEEASKDVAEVAARVLARYYGGQAGGAAVDRALQTKSGKKILRKASDTVAKDPTARRILARNQDKISQLKPLAHSVVDKMGTKNGDTTGSTVASNDSFKSNNSNSNTKSTLIIVVIIIAILLFVMIFIVIFITPLMSLGVIDIENIGSSGSSSNSEGYISVTDSMSYWWPVDSNKSTITSPYGQRYHPIDKVWKMHNGIDIAIEGGVNPGVVDIIASNSGTVTKIYTDCPTTNSNDDDKTDNNCGGGYGNYVMITHNDEKTTVYAHLYSVYVSLNSNVNKGQVIGKMGSSGNSTGTHLHYEVRINGERKNPTNYVSVDNKKT